MDGSIAPLALAGGEEWRDGCEAYDRRLLELAGTSVVHVLPTAAAAEGNPEGSVRWARRYFEALGATVEGVMVVDRSGAEDPAHADAVGGGRLLYLAGGSPPFLFDCLHGSALWAAVLEARRAGLVLAGSSAGAMVLGPSRLGIAPAEVLPHYEQRRASHRAPDGPALGIDARTAVVWDGTTWSVLGAGEVIVFGFERVGDLPPPTA